MVTKEGLREGWSKINGQLGEAMRFLEENKADEALYFIWLAAENIVNSLKTAINGFYSKEHREKSYILKDYFVLGTLEKDYSKTFEMLSRYRIAAGFHPYTSIPRNYAKEDVARFLGEIEELKKEVGKLLVKKGVLK